jgi:PPOX class probable F420-dependent enzyme
MATDIDRLGAERYVLLTTFRKDGRAVPTPVWMARDGHELFCYSAPDAGKVKRIRRDGAVRVGPCTARGKPTGDQVPGRARLLDEPATRHALRLLARKYGLLFRLADVGGRLRRRGGLPTGIGVVLD